MIEIQSKLRSLNSLWSVGRVRVSRERENIKSCLNKKRFVNLAILINPQNEKRRAGDHISPTTIIKSTSQMKMVMSLIIFLHLLVTIVEMTLKQISPPSPSLSILNIAVMLSKSLALLAQR